jgi:hypothetical protein
MVVRKIAAAVLFVISLGAGLVILWNQANNEDLLIGIFIIAVAFIVGFCVLMLIKKAESKVVLYETGVEVQSGRRLHRLHFNEIDGLREVPLDTVSGGVVGGVVELVVTEVALGIANALIKGHHKKQKRRTLKIIPNNGKEINVIDTAGEELSGLYTAWLIKEKEITVENLMFARLSFGQHLEFDRGSFVHKQKRNDRSMLPSEITRIEIANEEYQWLSFFGLNEKRKEKQLMLVRLDKIVNLDLLLYICSLYSLTEAKVTNQPKPVAEEVQPPVTERLTLEEQRALSVGAILSTANGEYLDRLSTGEIEASSLKKSRKRLAKWWGINDITTALDTLSWLANEGHSKAFDENRFVDGELLKQLYYADIIQNAAELQNISTLAWDMARLVNVARWCYDCEYLSEEEAWEYIHFAYQQSKANYESWEAFATGFLVGRARWNDGTDAEITEIVGSLLQDSNSPWVKFSLL